jgi:predicted acyl esterase
VSLQKKFLGHFLKGADTGWMSQPKVQIQIRRPGQVKFEKRDETEWPLARTEWTRYYLDPDKLALAKNPTAATARLEFEAMGAGLTFLSEPLREEMEITGPLAAKLFLSSSTTDADVFLVFRVFDPDGQEVTFYGALDPHTPIAQGWLRASHRKVDPHRSRPYRPYHTHDERQPLVPGEAVELDVEIWPTCIVIPAGYRFGLSILGKDYEWEGAASTLSNMKNPMRGCGPFVHDEVLDRRPEVFSGRNTVHFVQARQPYVLLPVIPAGTHGLRHRNQATPA